jgi:hypothetical protein
MRVQFAAASTLLVVVTILCSFPQRTISALNPKLTLNQNLQLKTNAKEVRTGTAVGRRAERLKQTSKAFKQAVKDLEDRGLKAQYSSGVSLFFARPKQEQHHARRAQDLYFDGGSGDPPPDTDEVSYFSYNSPPEKWIGIVYSNVNGVASTGSTELLITDQITELLSYVMYDDLGNIAGRYFNADYYDLSPWGIYAQPVGYYDLLANSGNCVSGCGVQTLFQQPRPSPGPTPGTKTPTPVSPSPTPNPRPMPGPHQTFDDPLYRDTLRCELSACLQGGFGCAFSGSAWPACVIIACGFVGPVACSITVK